MLQSSDKSLPRIIGLICLSIFFLIMFATSQLPSVLSSDRVASIVSFLTVIVFAIGLIVMAKSSCAVMMFALLLAVHAMVPVSRVASFVMSSSLVLTFLAVSMFEKADRVPMDDHFFENVSCFA